MPGSFPRGGQDSRSGLRSGREAPLRILDPGDDLDSSLVIRRVGEPHGPLHGATWVEPGGHPCLLIRAGNTLRTWNLSVGRSTRRWVYDELLLGHASDASGEVVAVRAWAREAPGPDVPLRVHRGGRPVLPELLPGLGDVDAVAVSPDGRWLAAAVEPSLPKVLVLDLEEGCPVADVRVRPAGETGRVRVVALGFSPSGRFLLTLSSKAGSRRHHLERWELPEGARRGGDWVEPGTHAWTLLPRAFLGGASQRDRTGWRLERFPEEPGRETGSLLWVAPAELGAFATRDRLAVLIRKGSLSLFAEGGEEVTEEVGWRLLPAPRFDRTVKRLVLDPRRAKAYPLGLGSFPEVDLGTGQVTERDPRANRFVPWTTDGVSVDHERGLLWWSCPGSGIHTLHALPLRGPADPPALPSFRSVVDYQESPLLSPDGGWVACRPRREPHEPWRIVLRHLRDPARDRALEVPGDVPLQARAFSPDGRWLAALTHLPHGGPVLHGLVDLEEDRWVGGHERRGAPLEHARFSPEGSYLAWFKEDRPRLLLLQPGQDHGARELELSGSGTLDAVFVGRERYLLLAGMDGRLRALDLRTRREVDAWTPPWGGLTALAADPDRDLLVAAGLDRCLYVLSLSRYLDPLREGRPRRDDGT